MMGFPGGASGKELPCTRLKRCGFNPWVGIDLLEKKMATHSSILAWRIQWTEDLAGYSLWGHKESDRTQY